MGEVTSVPHEPDPRRWRALAVTLAAGFMTLLDVSIVNVALPSIQNSLGASLAGIQWVVAGYALTFGLVLVPGGRLGDALGRRRMFLISLSAFVVTSALAGAATGETMLVIARLAQGAAAGVLTPQNSGLIQELFQGAERGRAFGAFGATVGLSTAIGPVLGGLIIAAFGAENGWRWVFFVNVPIGVVTLILSMLLLPRASSRGRRVVSELDFVGTVLLGLTVLCVLLPLVRSEQGGLREQWWLFPLAVVLGTVFIRWERWMVRRGRPPLVDLRLFTQTAGYSPGAAIGAIYFAGFTGIFLVFTLFFQQGLGYTPLQAGLVLTPFALGSAVSAAVGGKLVARWGRRVTIIGLALVALGLGAVALIVPAVSGPVAGLAVVGPLLVAGIGGGLVIPANTTLTLDQVPTHMAGVAGGALQTGQRLGTALGIAVLASVFQAGVAGGQGFPVALSWAMVCAVVLTAIALVVAVFDAYKNPHQALTEGTHRVTETGPFE